MAEDTNEKKQKFIFECTKCGNCCAERGPIPITFWDLKLWGSNGVVDNFLPYLQLYKHPKGFVDLILAPEDYSQENKEGSKRKCPLFSADKKECLVYDIRPLSCRTYPLEYDGEKYQIVDVDCPGLGNGNMSKEQRLQMKENAELMNKELVNMRISIPVLAQVIQKDIMGTLIKQQQEAMKNIDPETMQKINELMKK